jgi:putative flavoprotein involved in K+ transport
MREQVPVVVIGAGQAGLSVGHHLSRHGVRHVILEANPRVGDAWRGRWDSLRLFTPARYDGLAGMPFPAPADTFPSKDEMADYLEAYARHFDLPVRTGTRVHRLSRADGASGRGRRSDHRYIVDIGSGRIEASHVVVAMAGYQAPRTPPFAGDLDESIVQLHSAAYRSPAQLRDGGVLLVGAGNSGSEIAMEVAGRHHTWMAGRDVGHLPFNIHKPLGRRLARVVLRVLFHRVLTIDTPVGRKVRPKVVGRGGPLIRVRPQQLAALGVERVPKVVGVRDGRPLLEDGRVLDVANVVWCTGFHPGFSWIDLPVLGADGEPLHEKGIATSEPGLYFVGLHFLYALSSAMIHGVGRDAQRIAELIAASPSARPAEAADTLMAAVR